ncbi:MAG: hypothetical protein NUV59_00670 [Patescibacteria group bacterium]|nr:hypothetical protein [Patescibacteria group bacterium]
MLTCGISLKFPAKKAEFDSQPSLEPLHDDDVSDIGKEIKRLPKTGKYKNF